MFMQVYFDWKNVSAKMQDIPVYIKCTNMYGWTLAVVLAYVFIHRTLHLLSRRGVWFLKCTYMGQGLSLTRF